jgi:hypothetical protein
MENDMRELSIVCPKTRKRFLTGIHTDAGTIAKVWFAPVNSRCPHCGRIHAFEVRDAYIEATLSRETFGSNARKPQKSLLDA